MTPARPTSPTSLLWAHQLKREHNYLLERMQRLESDNEKQDQRLSSAESAAKSNAKNDIAALTEQVKALEDSGVVNRFERMEKKVMSKLHDLESDSEAMTLKVASLEKDESLVEAERRKAFNKEKALLKRVGECEENLRTYEKSLDQVGRKIDDESINQIKTQLEGLSEQVKREGSEMKFLSDSIVALELANAELQKANDRLAADIAKLAARPVPTPTSARSAADDVKSQPDENVRPRPAKKKPHKWAGGGADRDIIKQGSEMAASISPARKPKSHKWAGGGADRSIISQGLEKPETKKAAPKPAVSRTAAPKAVTPKASAPKSAAPGKPKTKKPKDNEPSQISKYTTAADAGKPIVRAGKGWIEVAYTPTDTEPEVSQGSSIKRPRGRPRKENSLNMFDGLNIGPPPPFPTAAMREPPSQSDNMFRKRKADDDLEVPSHSMRPSAATKNMKAAQIDAAKRTKMTNESGVFTSPVSSSRRTPEYGATEVMKDALLDAVRAQAAPPQPKRRRVIEQLDGSGA